MREADWQELRFYGPLESHADSFIANKLPEIAGIYVWCVRSPDGIYRVHYVGEAANLRSRCRQHWRDQLAGKYDAFLPTALRNNLKVLVHRARIGVVPRYQDELSAEQANRQYLGCISVFYAAVPEHASRSARCQFETAIAHAVEDWGQNILHVGKLNRRLTHSQVYRVTSGGNLIEGLTEQRVEVFLPEAT